MEQAGIDFARNGGDHAAIFKFVKTTAGSGKDEHRQTGVAKDEKLHFSAQASGSALVILAIHAFCFRRRLSVSAPDETGGRFCHHKRVPVVFEGRKG
jgi:hypothetical protein